MKEKTRRVGKMEMPYDRTHNRPRFIQIFSDGHSNQAYNKHEQAPLREELERHGAHRCPERQVQEALRVLLVLPLKGFGAAQQPRKSLIT